MTEVRRFAGSPYLEYTQKLEGDRFGAAGQGRREHPRITDYVQLRLERPIVIDLLLAYGNVNLRNSSSNRAF